MRFRLWKKDSDQPEDDGATHGPLAWTQAARRLKPIYRQTGLSPLHFNHSFGVLYQYAFSGAAGWNREDWHPLRRGILLLSESSLRQSRGRRFGQFREAEDQARAAKVSRFAMVAALTTEQIVMKMVADAAKNWRHMAATLEAGEWRVTPNQRAELGLVVVNSLFDDVCAEWLGRYEIARNEMFAYINGRRGEFVELIDLASKDVGVAVPKEVVEVWPAGTGPGGAGAGGKVEAPGGEASAAVADKAPAEGAAAEVADKAPAAKAAVAGGESAGAGSGTAATGGEAARPAMEFEVVQAGVEATVDEAAAERPAPKRTPRKNAAGWRWVDRVRAGVEEGSITVNDGYLHRIWDGAAFLIVPDCFRDHCEAEGIRTKTARNQVTKLNLHLRTRSSDRGPPNIRQAVLRDGKRERHVGGLVFENGKLFWGDDEPPGSEVLELR